MDRGVPTFEGRGDLPWTGGGVLTLDRGGVPTLEGRGTYLELEGGGTYLGCGKEYLLWTVGEGVPTLDRGRGTYLGQGRGTYLGGERVPTLNWREGVPTSDVGRSIYFGQ